MGKPTNCICENKGADQLRSNCEVADQLHSNCKADQRLCFRFSDSTIPPLLNSKNFKLLAYFCSCTGRFMSGLFGNHIVSFPTSWLIYLAIIAGLKRVTDKRSVPDIAQYVPYYLPLNIFTASTKDQAFAFYFIFQIYEEVYYSCSQSKSADQLCSVDSQEKTLWMAMRPDSPVGSAFGF